MSLQRTVVGQERLLGFVAFSGALPKLKGADSDRKDYPIPKIPIIIAKIC